MFFHSKILVRLMSFAALVVGLTSQIFGEGMLFRFEGQVASVGGDTFLASDSGLYPYQPFNFTIFIDPSQPGTFVDSNGVTQAITTLSSTAFPGFYENAFLVQFIEGNRIWHPAFASDGFGSANYGGSTTPMNTLFDPSNPDSPVTVTNAPWGALIMAGSPPNDLSTHWLLIIDKMAANLEDADPRNWQVGETFNALNMVTLNYLSSSVGGVVTLASISPVPEPSMVAFGSLVMVVTVLARSNIRRP